MFSRATFNISLKLKSFRGSSWKLRDPSTQRRTIYVIDLFAWSLPQPFTWIINECKIWNMLTDRLFSLRIISFDVQKLSQRVEMNGKCRWTIYVFNILNGFKLVKFHFVISDLSSGSSLHCYPPMYLVSSYLMSFHVAVWQENDLEDKLFMRSDFSLSKPFSLLRAQRDFYVFIYTFSRQFFFL